MDEIASAMVLSHQCRSIADALDRRGASFLRDLVKTTGLLASEVEDGLWELAAAGLVTADGVENLRALVDPKRRNGEGRGRFLRPRHAAGRWALLHSAIGGWTVSVVVLLVITGLQLTAGWPAARDVTLPEADRAGRPIAGGPRLS